MAKDVICFDLEGPLTPQDNAFNLMELVPNGRELFALVSKYVVLLTDDKRSGYEPGDTLSLIFPFLNHHGVKYSAIMAISKDSTLVSGAKELVKRYLAKNHTLYVVSTSYQPHARAIARRLGIPSNNVIATQVDPEKWNRKLPSRASAIIAEAEAHFNQHFFGSSLNEDEQDKTILQYLDTLYNKQLPDSGGGFVKDEIIPSGGNRKIGAVQQIAQEEGLDLQELVFVGDSITDAAVLQFVDSVGGLALAFNGNKFAIPQATVAIASRSLLALEPILNAWFTGRRAAVKNFIDNIVGETLQGDYVWRPNQSAQILQSTIERHTRIRREVRSEAIMLH